MRSTVKCYPQRPEFDYPGYCWNSDDNSGDNSDDNSGDNNGYNSGLHFTDYTTCGKAIMETNCMLIMKQWWFYEDNMAYDTLTAVYLG